VATPAARVITRSRKDAVLSVADLHVSHLHAFWRYDPLSQMWRSRKYERSAGPFEVEPVRECEFGQKLLVGLKTYELVYSMEMPYVCAMVGVLKAYVTQGSARTVARAVVLRLAGVDVDELGKPVGGRVGRELLVGLELTSS
jgi:hypothetical protein